MADALDVLSKSNGRNYEFVHVGGVHVETVVGKMAKREAQ